MTPEAAKPSSRYPVPYRNGTAPANGPSAADYPLSVLESLVTEDDKPVDGLFQSKQQRLLVEPLRSSWAGPAGDGLYLVDANVGVFLSPKEPPIVPDAFLSLGVAIGDDLSLKANRSYFVWLYRKPPDVVVEIVSNTKGGEGVDKAEIYARMGVKYYAVFDPFAFIGDELLRVQELRGQSYQRMESNWMPAIGLGLRLWQGKFEDYTSEWLRWCDEDGVVIPTGAEQAKAERERAKAANEQTMTERVRADAERERGERLAAKLRELGIDPEKI